MNILAAATLLDMILDMMQEKVSNRKYEEDIGEKGSVLVKFDVDVGFVGMQVGC